ncbi:Arylsulfatase precursor [Pirellulimonas nuda]|uniref:Arylsulfatase n=1 Tax=Pirellulimonas nuda TaxID=2528009 RepID=A0A518DBX6_9BACT|nr:arylsulfatase [Pirellulimonas nuda]QDU88960.1 Arylsulfatase precursor [Pirellulimonas nuda]
MEAIQSMHARLCILAALLLFGLGFAGRIALAAEAPRPNVVLIITDDMGFSDVGCYGGEIETPSIDALARGGLKFSQFYNCGKCEPSRAALTTGHQFWTYYPNVAVRKDSPNFGEVLQTAGYRTMMVGKWHCAGVPFERGFDRHFGFMGGGTNFFLGDDSFTLDGRPWPVPKEDFYVTTALTDYADKFIRQEHAAHPDQPFFLYLAYNAPHSPIQAPADQVAKYRGKYLSGWDEIRKARFAKQQALGLAGPGWNFPDRPANIPAWNSLDVKSRDFEDLRMATYAAMVDCVDQGVGRLTHTLNELGVADNTLVIFMNDNGASPNDRVRRGEFGTPNTTWNTGVGWAHASNTPLKYYKRTQHSGGVTTPFIASWPSAIEPRAAFEDQPLHITDVLPTLIELAGARYPRDFRGKEHPPLPGRSFAQVLTAGERLAPKPLYFSLFNNMAIVDGGWRMVTAYDQPWQLYDLTDDRSETHDLAASNPTRLNEMLALQKAYAQRPDVRLRLKPGEREPKYAPIYNAVGRIGPGAREKVSDEPASLARAKKRSVGVQLREPARGR